MDGATENVIVRLTALSSSNLIPNAHNRFVSRARTLIFASNRTGQYAPFQVDLRSGLVKQIADAAKLNARSLCLDRTEKLVRYLAGDALFEAGLNRGSPRKIGDGISAFGNSADGTFFLD